MATLASAALAAITFGAAAAAAAEHKQPNILVILADDLGYGELTAQGYTKEIPTPHIDSIAANGIRFTSGYVSGPYCSPTRAALLSGRYQQRLGHEFNPGPATAGTPGAGLDLTQKTIGDRLKAAGYATAWIGKSHLGYEPEFHPNKRGFDHFYGFLGGAHSFLEADGKGRDPIQRNGQPVDKIGYLTEELGRESAEFIEKNSNQPWLAYVAFNAVHAPLESTDKYLARFASIADPKRQKFAAHLSALDDAVGVVLAKLKDTKQEEKTLVFFLSDNGGPTPTTTAGNGPLRGFKAQTWEGGVRVPWFVQWKGRIPAGKVDDRPVIQLDIFPTALAAAGVPVQGDWKVEGVNLLPYFTGENAGAPHDALFWRFGSQIAIRKGDWKLVKAAGKIGEIRQGDASTDEAQLYNLANDIGEQTDLAAKEPAKLKELAEAWQTWNKDNIAPKWGGRIGGGRNGTAANNNATPSNATAAGPWKSGDALAGDDAPQIAGHGFAISAKIDSATPKGVILAHGGQGNGYALYVQDGKLALALRVKRELTVVTATEALPGGQRLVAATVDGGGRITLAIDGKTVGEGKVSQLANQPGEGLTVGNDGRAPVGEYEAPNDFNGKVESASVKVL